MRVEKAIKQKPNKLDYCCFVAVFINDFSISTLLLGCLSIDDACCSHTVGLVSGRATGL